MNTNPTSIIPRDLSLQARLLARVMVPLSIGAWLIAVPDLDLFIALAASATAFAFTVQSFRAMRFNSHSWTRSTTWFLASFFWFVLVAAVSGTLTNWQMAGLYTRYRALPFVVPALGSCLLVLAGFLLGATLALNRRSTRPPSEEVLGPINLANSVARWRLITVLSLVLFLIFVFQTGGRGLLATRSERLRDTSEVSAYLFDAPLLAIGATIPLLIAHFVYKHTLRSIAGVLVIMTLWLMPYFIRGDRSFIIPVVVYFLGIFAASRVNTRLRNFLLPFALSPVLLVAPRLYRLGKLSVQQSILDAYQTQNLLDSISGLDSNMFVGFAFLCGQYLEGKPLLWGTSYLEALVRFVPRTLWNGKPVAFDTQLNLEFFPETANQGVGFSFLGLSEPMLNFGLIGLLAFGLAVGYVTARIDWNYAVRSDVKSLTVALITSGFMPILLRGNLTTDYPRLLMVLLPAILICSGTRRRYKSSASIQIQLDRAR